MRRLAHAALLATILLGPRPAAAQGDAAQEGPGASARRDEGRAEFEAGLSAARAGDWASAHDRFARAHQLAPQPSVLMNLAGAQRRTGRLLAAAASYRQWLDTATSERDRQRRPEVEEVLARLEDATPRLTVGCELGPEDALDIDGASAVPDREILLDPGPHTVAVLRGGVVIVRSSVHLREGERERIVLELTGDGAASADDERERRIEDAITAPPPSAAEDPTGWIVLGTTAGVVVLAAVIVGVVFGVSSSAPQPYTGNVPPGTWDIR
ncbi:hypothetical protein [Sandaracinus amylolyticus]|uniref:hypothetical protein n=1 Tax=Sandaracinus amylolyticus TaxID=927083 RepID=UPI001F465D56|nr:hypothetical protein [Sandaracinus amylolyticus]